MTNKIRAIWAGSTAKIGTWTVNEWGDFGYDASPEGIRGCESKVKTCSVIKKVNCQVDNRGVYTRKNKPPFCPSGQVSYPKSPHLFTAQANFRVRTNLNRSNKVRFSGKVPSWWFTGCKLLHRPPVKVSSVWWRSVKETTLWWVGIEDPKVIEQILKHLKQKAAKANAAKQHELPPERAPPLVPGLFEPSQSRLFDWAQVFFFTLLTFTAAGGATYTQLTIHQVVFGQTEWNEAYLRAISL